MLWHNIRRPCCASICCTIYIVQLYLLLLRLLLILKRRNTQVPCYLTKGLPDLILSIISKKLPSAPIIYPKL